MSLYGNYSVMDKKEVIKQIVEIIEPSFIKQGFENKKNRFFEKKEGENVFQYEIDLGTSKGYFSMHLKLNLLNKKISNCYNSVMRKVLTDKKTTFPPNWAQKDIESSIKGRTKVKTIAMLTDWRDLKEEKESLEDFNSRFSIWLYAFDELNKKKNWKEQLLLSVELAIKWFNMAQTDDYLIENTTLFGLCVLKMKNNDDKLDSKYDEIIARENSLKRDTTEIELFLKYLKEFN